MLFGVNSGHRTMTKPNANDKRPLGLGKKGVYSSYTLAEEQGNEVGTRCSFATLLQNNHYSI